jgi:thioredoxin reductase-like selenoprotein T
VAQFLESQFPELEGRIYGNLYPPPPMARLLANILSAVQLLGIAWMITGGETLLRLIPFYKTGPLPSWYYSLQENPVPFMIFLFLLAPQMIGGMQSNGAFEVYLDNDVVIFSKLQSGRLPTVDDLINPLVAAGLRKAQA